MEEQLSNFKNILLFQKIDDVCTTHVSAWVAPMPFERHGGKLYVAK